MSTSAGILTVDVLPNLDALPGQLSDGLTTAALGAGPAATKAGQSLGSLIGGGLQTLGSQIGGELGLIVGKVGTGLDQLGRSGSNLGLKLAAVGGTALGLGVALQSMGSADSAAQQQLQAAITATGNTWGDYATQIDTTIKAGENFGQNAAQTQGALQALTTATNDPTKALQFMGVAFDLAAARHIDLVSAATLVARALEGNTRILKQYGIDTTGVATSSTAAAAAVTVLGTKLAGQAAASVNTFNGRIDVAKAKIGDLAAEFSGPLGAGLQGFGAGTAIVGGILQSKLIQNMRSAVSEADGFGGKMQALGGPNGVLFKLGAAAGVAAAGFLGMQAVLASATSGGPQVNELSKQLDSITSGQHLANIARFGQDMGSLSTELDHLASPSVIDRMQNFSASVFGSDTGSYTRTKVITDIKTLDSSLTTMATQQGLPAATAAFTALTREQGLNSEQVKTLLALLPGYRNDLAGVGLGLDGVTAALQANAAAAADDMTKVLGLRKSLYDSKATMADSATTVTSLGKKTKLSADDMAKGMDAAAAAIQAAADAQSNVALKGPAMQGELAKLEAHTKRGSALWVALQGLSTQLDNIARNRAAQLQVDVTLTGNGVPFLKGLGIKAPPLGIGVLHPAGGGYITGPGTSTSDSIPAMVSSREFVVNAAAVQRIGVDQLQRINAGQSPRGGNTTTITVNGVGLAEVARSIALEERKRDMLYGPAR